MDQNTVTLVIGLAGIISTLAASGLGLYYTAKSRSAPLREMLYEKQLELITQIIHRQARFRIFAVLLGSPEFRDRAREDLAEIMREYSELAERAAAILPTDLWVEIKNLNGAMSDLLGTYDQKKTVDKKSAERIAGMDAKVALMSRVVLGVDALTDESLGIFSSTKGLERVAAIESDHYLQLARDKDA